MTNGNRFERITRKRKREDEEAKEEFERYYQEGIKGPTRKKRAIKPTADVTAEQKNREQKAEEMLSGRTLSVHGNEIVMEVMSQVASRSIQVASRSIKENRGEGSSKIEFIGELPDQSNRPFQTGSKQLYRDFQSLKKDVETRISNHDTTITLDLLADWNQQAKVLGGTEALELRKTIGIFRMTLSKKIFDMRYDTPEPYFLTNPNDIVNKFEHGGPPFMFEVKTILKSLNQLPDSDLRRSTQYITYLSKKNKIAIINRCYRNEDSNLGKDDEGEAMAIMVPVFCTGG